MYYSPDRRVTNQEFTELVMDAKDNAIRDDSFEDFSASVGLLKWMLLFDEDDPGNKKGEPFSEEEWAQINDILQAAWDIAQKDVVYVVSQFTIYRGVKSSTNDSSFKSLEDAQEFYSSINLHDDWITEKDCQPSHKLQLMENIVFAKELYKFDAVEEEYGDTLEYEEFGIDDYREEDSLVEN